MKDKEVFIETLRAWTSAERKKRAPLYLAEVTNGNDHCSVAKLLLPIAENIGCILFFDENAVSKNCSVLLQESINSKRVTLNKYV